MGFPDGSAVKNLPAMQKTQEMRVLAKEIFTGAYGSSWRAVLHFTHGRSVEVEEGYCLNCMLEDE